MEEKPPLSLQPSIFSTSGHGYHGCCSNLLPGFAKRGCTFTFSPSFLVYFWETTTSIPVLWMPVLPAPLGPFLFVFIFFLIKLLCQRRDPQATNTLTLCSPWVVTEASRDPRLTHSFRLFHGSSSCNKFQHWLKELPLEMEILYTCTAQPCPHIRRMGLSSTCMWMVWLRNLIFNFTYFALLYIQI